jgi:hypothetical protein
LGLKSEETTRAVAGSYEGRQGKHHTADWGRIYAECVGSLSELKSETEPDVLSMSFSEKFDAGTGATLEGLASMELRQSTSDFQRQLGREQEKAREELIEKLERISKQGEGKGKKDGNKAGEERVGDDGVEERDCAEAKRT